MTHRKHHRLHMAKKTTLRSAAAFAALALLHSVPLAAFPAFSDVLADAGAGDPGAQAIAATYYALGWQTAKDPALAARYARQSADAGDPLGKFRLGALLRSGEGTAKDEASGLRLQKEATGIWAEKGYPQDDPFTLTAIGVALFQGKVLQQDKATAAQFYKKAADMGFAPAQFNYAMCAKDGQGIPKDPALCAEYLSKAAASGYRLAHEALGQPAPGGMAADPGDAMEEESIATAGPISGGLNLQFASTSPQSAPAPIPLLANAGPISGSFSFGGEPSPATAPEAKPDSATKQLTVTGIGLDPAAAEKEAIRGAVRQAVGAYIDSSTLVQNEAVIRDRILAVSNGFVKEYKVLSPPRQRDDGLYETTILATVETNRVVQALKENNILAGDVAGHNIYAEATTKVMNAQDAVAMLQAKVPELIKSCVTITPLDKNGNPMIVKDPEGRPVLDSSGKPVPSTAPALTKEDAVKGTVTLTWLLEIGVDKKYYRETLFPLVKECMDAIAGVPAKPAKMALEKRGQIKLSSFNSSFNSRLPAELGTMIDDVRFGFPRRKAAYGESSYPILISSITRNFDRCDYFWYDEIKNKLQISYRTDEGSKTIDGTMISLEALDSNSEVIAFANAKCWQPFTSDPEYGLVGLGCSSYGGLEINPITVLDLTIPISDAKEIKNVKIALEVLEPAFSLQSSQK